MTFNALLAGNRRFWKVGHALVFAIFPTAEFTKNAYALKAFEDIAFLAAFTGFSVARVS